MYTVYYTYIYIYIMYTVYYIYIYMCDQTTDEIEAQYAERHCNLTLKDAVRIGSTHVAHHVCAAIPFYKAPSVQKV